MFQESAGTIFLRYAIPQMVGLLFNSIYVIVDGVFIGARLGSSALAAAGAAVPAVELLVALSMAVTSGAGVLISVRLAASDRKKALQAFNTCMLLQAVISFIIAFAGNLFIHPLARMLGATPEIHDMTVTYLRYILTFSPFLLFSYLMGGLARNDGKPGLAMAALSLGSLSNIVLDYVFMYPFNMGIAGAALATAVGPLFSILILLPHFLRRNGRLYFARVRLSLSDAGRFLTLDGYMMLTKPGEHLAETDVCPAHVQPGHVVTVSPVIIFKGKPSLRIRKTSGNPVGNLHSFRNIQDSGDGRLVKDTHDDCAKARVVSGQAEGLGTDAGVEYFPPVFFAGGETAVSFVSGSAVDDGGHDQYRRAFDDIGIAGKSQDAFIGDPVL